MSKESIIDLKKPEETVWEVASGETHSFKLLQYKACLLEAEKERFHCGSAVFLPDFVPNDKADEKLSGLAILRACYLYAENNPTKKILLIGHTDTTGEESYNAKLSQKRAENVLYLLIGDRDKWISNSQQTHRVEDYQKILRWVARSWGATCNPRGVDNKLGVKTKRAIRSFKAWYNEEFEKKLKVNDKVDEAIWGAFYDVYLDELSLILDTNLDGLSLYQSKLVFLNDNCKASGGGKNYPIDSHRENCYRSPNHRRTEILFFEPGDEPETPAKPTVNVVPKELDIIYLSYLYCISPIIVEPVQHRVWIDLQTVNHFGLCEPNIELILQSGNKTPIQLTTNDEGYWNKRVLVGNKISINMADGRPVRLGSIKPTDNKNVPLVITAEDVGLTIRDIIVPTLSQEDIAEQEKLVKVYGRLKSAGEKGTLRSGATVESRGKPKTLSSRGGEEDVTHLLTIGDTITDNLCIAAGWDKNFVLDYNAFFEILHAWLSDRFPSTVSRGYFVQLLSPGGLVFADPTDLENARLFTFSSGKGIYSARYGAYATFETSPINGNNHRQLYVDMATQSGQIFSGDIDKIKYKKYSDKPKKGDSDDGFVDTLAELIEEGSVAEYNKLIDIHDSKNQVNIVYFLLNKPNLPLYSKEGGTGLLENYAKQKGIRQRIHKRNCSVATNVGNAYEAYLADYIRKVNDISPSWKDFKVEGSVLIPKGEHPELRLFKLGPPDSSFRFPRAVGASKDEYREVCELTGRKTIDCWEAITKKLNAIRGEKGDGSIWFEVEFSLEAGEYAGPLSGASLKLNFEVNHDNGLQIISKSEKEISLTAKAVPDSAGAPANVKFSVKYDEKTQRQVKTVEFSIGKYGIEADNTGSVKLKVGMFDQSMNQRTAVVSAGASVSLRDLVGKAFKQTPPDWVAKLPDVKASAKISVKLLSHGTLMRVITKSPGFFEMRPRVEFDSLLWHLLSSDEHIFLEVLGWDQESWDFGIRPESAKKDYYILSPDEQFAATRLPIPVWDPYWLEYWVRFSNSRNG
jgi:hypothetical protein